MLCFLTTLLCDYYLHSDYSILGSLLPEGLLQLLALVIIGVLLAVDLIWILYKKPKQSGCM